MTGPRGVGSSLPADAPSGRADLMRRAFEIDEPQPVLVCLMPG